MKGYAKSNIAIVIPIKVFWEEVGIKILKMKMVKISKA
jgi:hypothetical protein